MDERETDVDRSIEAFGHWRDAQDKFDHFVLLILIAVCGYLAQTTEFVRLGFDLQSLQILALMMFGVSAVAGFKRVETMTIVYRVNHQLLEAKEKNESKRVAKALEGLNKLSGRALRWYRIRNFVMLLAFIAYLISKLAQPYVAT